MGIKNKVLEDLTKLNFRKKAWIVHRDYKYVDTGNKCRYCKGKGSFKHGTQEYGCVDCGCTGKSGKYKHIYCVSCIKPDEETFTVSSNTVETCFYKDIRGIFNTKKLAFDLADKLNKGE